jgi:hypothetical protein
MDGALMQEGRRVLTLSFFVLAALEVLFASGGNHFLGCRFLLGSSASLWHFLPPSRIISPFLDFCRNASSWFSRLSWQPFCVLLLCKPSVSSFLFLSPDSKHLCTALRTNTFHSFTPVLHFDYLGILHFPLGFTLDTVRH